MAGYNFIKKHIYIYNIYLARHMFMWLPETSFRRESIETLGWVEFLEPRLQESFGFKVVETFVPSSLPWLSL